MRVLPASVTTLSEALTVLRTGGVVAHATETCYGLACDLSNLTAVSKLFAIKHRPPAQPVSALFASRPQAQQYVEWNERAEELADKHLPGPLTIILPIRKDAPKQLFPITHPSQHIATLGLRISSHPLAQSLVEAFGSPLSTTSANVHGEPNPYDAHSIAKRFIEEEWQPDLVIDSGHLPQVPPSTVIDLTEQGRVLRAGSLPK